MIKLNQLADLSAEKQEVKVDVREGLTVTVKPSLSLEEKVRLIEEIVIACSYGSDPYLNPLKLKTLATLKVINESTDIEVFEDEEKDIYEIYDILNSSGVLDKIIPFTDYQEIVNWAYDSSESLINYNNSLMGALAELKNHFNSEDFQNQFGSIFEELKNNPDLTNLLKLYESEGLSN